MKIEKVIKQLESILDHTRSMAASSDADEIWKEDSDALEFALTALRSMPEAGEPLSLEQLKQMDENPVWIEDKEYPINTRWVIWDGNFTEEWVNGEPREEYGKTWFAYSYLPVFSDVKVFCGSWVGEADGYADGELMYDVWRCGNCGHVEETDDPVLLPRFCPECGRAMTLEAWAELERRLSGENP